MNAQKPNEDRITRRRFLARLAKAGAAVAATGSLGYLLYETEAPSSSLAQKELVSVPDFSLAEPGPRMAIARGPERALTVTRAFEALGGIDTFIKKGDRVLLKVNAAFATPATLSATTHPELLSQVIRLCLSAGASEVVVTDNPINDPQSCFQLTGIGKAVEAAGGRLIVPREGYFKPTTLDKGTLLKNWPLLHSPLEKITKLIGIAPVKDHNRSGASMTMKNWYGLLGGQRNIFHQDIHTIIKELAMMVRPTLVILDGTTTMMTNGPTGGALSDLKPTNTMIVSTDQVAADAFGATLLEKRLTELPFISMAAQADCGTFDYETLNPIYV